MDRPPAAQDGARVRRDLTLALSGLAGLLVVLLVVAGLISRELQTSAERAFARDALPVKTTVDDLLVQMLNQETAVRGYLINDRMSSLAPYQAGRAATARDLAALERAARSHPMLRTLLPRARADIARLEAFFDGEIAMVRAGPAGRANARAHVGRGKALFDAFRTTAARMRAATDAFVARTVSRQRERYHTLLVALGVLGAAALAVAAALVAIVPRRAARLVGERARHLDEERETAELLRRLLAASPHLFEGDPDDVPRRVCAGAVEVFGCAAASLWRVERDALRLVQRVPWDEEYRGDDRRPIDELPGLREALDAARPMFVGDLAGGSAGATRRTARATSSGSLLNLPIAVAGVSELVLGLLWGEQVPAPSEARRLAAQRFADQAGLALEQARRRRAQDEIEALNRTLSQMVQTDPLFRAGGTREEVVRAICEAAVRIFDSQAAALWLYDSQHRGLTLVHRLPATDALPIGVRLDLGRYPDFLDDLERGRPRFMADVEHDLPDLWEQHARSSGSRSQLRLPLASAGGAGALIVLSWRERVAPPSGRTSALAARFADQAALALAEAQRREAARAGEALHAQLERSLLPTIHVDDPHVQVASLYRPGDERLSLGGDFYDCLELPGGRIAVLIGDVSGHGPAAAALGAGLRGAWRGLVLAGVRIADLLPTLEEVVEREREDRGTFATAITAELDAGRARLRVAAAGHPPPVMVGTPARGALQPGPPLGVDPAHGFPVAELALAPPASLVFYTDGLVEGRAAPGSVERFGIARLEALLARTRPGSVGEHDLRALVAEATRAHGEGLPDDVAVLAINLAGGVGPAGVADAPAARSGSVPLGAPSPR